MSLFKNLFGGKSDGKDEKKAFLEDAERQIFPNGQIDIVHGTDEVLFILQNKVDRDKAKFIFRKSAALIFVVEPDKRTKNRLISSLEHQFPNLFSDAQYQQLFNYLVARSVSFMLGGTQPKRNDKGGYSF